ncbi:MAG: hypothetical protein KAI81_01220 [Candidatus Marinimicrobia bacterium]|nr:hypothetical protein [Candidatus Neomarinimicrobiota bacterium]
MKNIPRPSRWLLHDEELKKDEKRFDLGSYLNRYRGSRSLIHLVILFSILAWMVYWLADFPVK